MNKQLKRCYSYLNLPYNANIDEVENNEKALVKIFQSKAERTKRNFDKKINKVVDYSNQIIDNINQNGIPKTKAKMKTRSENALIVQFFIFIVFVVICIISFVNLL